MKLPARAKTPMSSYYKPNLDATAQLEPYENTMYQELIGELWWAIEIVIFDILYEVSVLFSYKPAPRSSHLQKILHIFAFLKNSSKLTFYFDPNLAIIDPT